MPDRYQATSEDEAVEQVATAIVDWQGGGLVADERSLARAIVRALGSPWGRSPYVDIARERMRQDAKWGEQNHRDGTGRPGSRGLADRMRAICKANGPIDDDNWQDILAEEVFEAFAETDPTALRTELVQVAAVAVQWIEAIDRRYARVWADDGH